MTANLKVLIGKLDSTCKKAAEQAVNHCMSRGQYEVDLEHLFLALLDNRRSDFSLLCRHYDISPTALEKDLVREIAAFKSGNTRTPVFSAHLPKLFEHAWLLASLDSRVARIRSAHLLLALLTASDLSQLAFRGSKQFAQFSADDLKHKFGELTSDFPETIEAMDFVPGIDVRDVGAAECEKRVSGRTGTPALDQFTTNLTERARAGVIDPVIGRDAEIRLAIDILMRRRQNNPILTGEAGVGKTAVVEGLAQRMADGDVPPSLRGVELHVLDLGLLQAGASVKGEFENRLQSVIDEVKRSPHPIILFIDEAHNMIGAGGTAGQNDAANLLKPVLARGELRTIAATTWSEYKKYFERDAALARRFQLICVEEPSEAVACAMLRGLASRMEQHFKVRVLDEAITAAVRLSARYINGRQLPDKAISVLDTACARVALGKTATPAAVEDARRLLAGLSEEIRALEKEVASGGCHAGRLEELRRQREVVHEKLRLDEERWQKELSLVRQIVDLREELERDDPGDAWHKGHPEGVAEATESVIRRAETSKCPGSAERLQQLEEQRQALSSLQGEYPLVPVCVDRQVVGEIVAAWTGIPIGKMVKDEIKTVLDLKLLLGQRVIGQPHALEQIARHIRTVGASLDDPDKPKGVFMFVGPSGVGKTETALAMADVLFGGERNLLTINMSEYQEAHSVAGLKGAPPGYVGYGEGGTLTEAVRRKPYSVVLLDEVEKAHPDVLELFFQVFDKGVMDDAEGRQIDFRNTVIILTSNVGSAGIMQACLNKGTDELPDAESLCEAIRPQLYKTFKAAFLGRLKVVPYYPLPDAILADIIRLKLERIRRRVEQNHKASLAYSRDVVEAVLARCTEVDSGARNVDHILNSTMLPEIAQTVLVRMVEGKAIESVRIGVSKDNRFTYRVH